MKRHESEIRQILMCKKNYFPLNEFFELQVSKYHTQHDISHFSQSMGFFFQEIVNAQ